MIGYEYPLCFSIFAFISYSSGSLFVIGFLFLLCCLFIFFFLLWCNYVWYSLLFWMVYVGGLLVLFFYVLSLHSNSYASIGYSYLIVGLVSCYFFFVIFDSPLFDYCFFSFINDHSYLLFVGYEFGWLFYTFSFLVLSLFFVNSFTGLFCAPLRPLFV